MNKNKFLSLRAISREFPDLTRWKLEKIFKDKSKNFPKPIKLYESATPKWKADDIEKWLDSQ